MRASFAEGGHEGERKTVNKSAYRFICKNGCAKSVGEAKPKAQKTA
jgi:hypothetical protein